jgi:hypothetical protein
VLTFHDYAGPLDDRRRRRPDPLMLVAVAKHPPTPAPAQQAQDTVRVNCMTLPLPQQGLRAKVLKPYNAVARPVARKRFPPWALLHQWGGSSVRTYLTPLGAFPYGDGSVLGLAYGPDVDWCRNVTTSGRASLRRHGHEYAAALECPQPIPMSTAVLQAIPLYFRLPTRALKQCLWLHRPNQTAESAPSEAD